MQSVRVFIAIDIGETIRRNLAKLQRELQRSGADMRWTAPETMHLTLAFLGNIPEHVIEPLAGCLDHRLHLQESFTLSARGTGVFGGRRKPSVVWAGVVESPALLSLQQRVVSGVEDTGIAFDNGPFRPHLTLGRFRPDGQLATLYQTLERKRDQSFGNMRVESVALYKSELLADGARHTLLHRCPLG